MTFTRPRLLIAGTLTATMLTLTYLWLDLFLSGATFYQGRASAVSLSFMGATATKSAKL